MTGDCWPTSDQTLLLQAALLDGAPAKVALWQWRSATDFDHLDRASTRLLPLLYQRLQIDDVNDPLLPRLRELSDRAASQNQALAETAVDAVQLLRKAGVDSLLLKGIALIARGYMPLGARTMADCDLLVPEDQALAARDALTREGWRLEGRLDRDLLSVRHAVSLRSPDGRRLDLHWHVLAECCNEQADVDFWQAAMPAMLNGVRTHTLCPADMVLHTCVHGLRWSLASSVRWVSDVMMIIRTDPPSIDWERVVEQAERRILVLPLIDSLRYLKDNFGAPVPSWVHSRLSQVTVPRWAVGEYRIKMRRRSRQRQLLFHWFQHRRLSSSGSLLEDLVGVPAYVHRRWPFRSFTSSKG